MYQLRGTLFGKLNSFGIFYTNNQKLFKNMTVLDFESNCVEDGTFKDTKTTTWTGKHISNLISISSHLIQKPILLCNPNLRDLVSSFKDAIDNLATQKSSQENELFPKRNHNKKWTCACIKVLNQHRSHCVGFEAEDNNKSTHFPQMQKKSIHWLAGTIWEIAIHYQYLGSKVRSAISNASRVILFVVSWRNEILNWLLSKNPTNLFRSTLVIFNFLTF